MISKAEKLEKTLKTAEVWIGSVFLGLIFIIIVVNILCRYILDISLFWSSEVSSFLFVWMALLGCAWARAGNQHIRVNLLVKRFSARGRFACDLIMDVIFVAMSGLIAATSLKSIAATTGKTLALRIPEIYIMIILPLSFVLMAIHTIIKYIKTYNKNPKNGSLA